MKITRDQVTEYEVHKFSAEASSLGLPPGRWPNGIETSLGNGQDLRMTHLDEVGAHYRQQLGCITLTIFND